MSNLAVIPARGGSKRIPLKNIRDFLGKPIIAYSIEIALKSGLFDEVMVSTDDEKIAEVAQKYGATVPFYRSADAADDYATLADVMEEVKLTYEEEGKVFEYICCILPTAPFVTVENLEKGLQMVRQNDVDSVRPVVEFPYPVQRALKKNEDGTVEMFYPEHRKTRTQDLEPAYYDAGQFYWMRWEPGLRGDKRTGFEISQYFAQDIDTFEDWAFAEMKYEMVRREKSG